jgi:hypothetical protein
MNTPAISATRKRQTCVNIRVYPWQVSAKDMPRHAVAEFIVNISIFISAEICYKGSFLWWDAQLIKQF